MEYIINIKIFIPFCALLPYNEVTVVFDSSPQKMQHIYSTVAFLLLCSTAAKKSKDVEAQLSILQKPTTRPPEPLGR